MDPAAQAILIRADAPSGRHLPRWSRWFRVTSAAARAVCAARTALWDRAASLRTDRWCLRCNPGDDRRPQPGKIDCFRRGAHSDHGRDWRLHWKRSPKGEAPGYAIRDVAAMGRGGPRSIPTEGAVNDVALDVALQIVG